MMLHLARVYAVGAALAAVRAGRCHRVVLAPLQVLQLGRSVAISRKYAQRCVHRGQAVMLACAGCQLASIRCLRICMCGDSRVEWHWHAEAEQHKLVSGCVSVT